MPNAVTYCRVSSEEQAEKDISIPAQRKALRRWVEEQQGLELVHEFVDEGQSAYAPASRRPGFGDMVSYCRKHDVAFILVHKLDRFSRNREESILFKSMLRKHGVTVKSITENFDPETPQGFLYEGMIEVINQFYSMNLATETMKGMRENAERGWYNGGRSPYGYRVLKVLDGARERGKLTPGPEEQVAVVKEAFDLAAHHAYGGRKIANLLNARQTPAPNGGTWNASAVNNILDNPVYVGDSVWFKSRRSGREGRERTAADERIVTRDAHPALIDRETWDCVRKGRTRRRFDVTRNPGRQATYLLSQVMRCGHCGHSFVGRRNVYKTRDGVENTQLNYLCSGYIGKGTAVCRSVPIDAAWAEAFVLDIIKARLCETGSWAAIERQLRARIEGRRNKYGTDAKGAELRLADIDRRIQNFYRAIGDGADHAACQKHIEELQAKRARVAEEASVLRKEDYFSLALENNLSALRRFRDAFAKEFDRIPAGIRREVVLMFVEELVVENHAELRVSFKVPFNEGGITELSDSVAGSSAGSDSKAGDGPEEALGPTRRQYRTEWLPMLDRTRAMFHVPDDELATRAKRVREFDSTP